MHERVFDLWNRCLVASCAETYGLFVSREADGDVKLLIDRPRQRQNVVICFPPFIASMNSFLNGAAIPAQEFPVQSGFRPVRYSRCIDQKSRPSLHAKLNPIDKQRSERTRSMRSVSFAQGPL